MFCSDHSTAMGAAAAKQYHLMDNYLEPVTGSLKLVWRITKP